MIYYYLLVAFYQCCSNLETPTGKKQKNCACPVGLIFDLKRKEEPSHIRTSRAEIPFPAWSWRDILVSQMSRVTSAHRTKLCSPITCQLSLPPWTVVWLGLESEYTTVVCHTLDLEEGNENYQGFYECGSCCQDKWPWFWELWELLKCHLVWSHWYVEKWICYAIWPPASTIWTFFLQDTFLSRNTESLEADRDP